VALVDKLNAACRDEAAVLRVFGPPDYSECPELRPVPTPPVVPELAAIAASVGVACTAEMLDASRRQRIERAAAAHEPLIVARAAEQVRAKERAQELEGWAIRPASASTPSPAAVLV
jgi:hypothetical protein